MHHFPGGGGRRAAPVIPFAAGDQGGARVWLPPLRGPSWAFTGPSPAAATGDSAGFRRRGAWGPFPATGGRRRPEPSFLPARPAARRDIPALRRGRSGESVKLYHLPPGVLAGRARDTRPVGRIGPLVRAVESGHGKAATRPGVSARLRGSAVGCTGLAAGSMPARLPSRTAGLVYLLATKGSPTGLAGWVGAAEPARRDGTRRWPGSPSRREANDRTLAARPALRRNPPGTGGGPCGTAFRGGC